MTRAALWTNHRRVASQPHGFLGNEITGQKPEAFCFWIFDLLGLGPDDEFVDLFPGSGAVGRAWEKWRNQGTIWQELASRAGGQPAKAGT